jgi:hypothetical protein
MTFCITDDGLLLEDVLDISRPPAHRRAHAISALRHASPLFDYISLAPDTMKQLLDPQIESTPEGRAAQQVFADLARAHALDLYADSGKEAQAWPYAVAEAVHTLRTLIEDVGHPPRTWSLQSPHFILVLTHDLPGPAPSSALRLVDPPPAVAFHMLTITEVQAQLETHSAKQVWRDAKRIHALATSMDLPMLAIATGALQALIAVSALTGYTQFSLGGGTQNWNALLSSTN